MSYLTVATKVLINHRKILKSEVRSRDKSSDELCNSVTTVITQDLNYLKCVIKASAASKRKHCYSLPEKRVTAQTFQLQQILKDKLYAVSLRTGKRMSTAKVTPERSYTLWDHDRSSKHQPEKGKWNWQPSVKYGWHKGLNGVGIRTWAISLLSPLKKNFFIDPATDRSGSLHMKWSVVFCALKVLISSICDVTSLSFSSFETERSNHLDPFSSAAMPGKHWDDSSQNNLSANLYPNPERQPVVLPKETDVWSWRSVMKLSLYLFFSQYNKMEMGCFLKVLVTCILIVVLLGCFLCEITGFTRTVFPFNLSSIQ